LLLLGSGTLAVYAAIPGQSCRPRTAQALPLQPGQQLPVLNPAQNADWQPDPKNPQQECRSSRSRGGWRWSSGGSSSSSATHSTASRGGFGGSGGGHGFGG
jgi:uncharacterized membrane protein YgcG